MKHADESLYAYINKDGESSFAGAMQINNRLDVDDVLTIKNGGNVPGRVTINPGTNSDTLTVEGGIHIRNGSEYLNASISQGGNGFFAAGLSTGGNASFAGSLQVVGATELNNSLTILEGTNTKASISAGGNASFAGTMQVGSTTDSTTTTSGALKVAGGLGVAKTIFAADISSGSVTVTDVTDSTTTTSGALKVTGGVGIGKKLYVGDTVTGTDFIIPSDRRFKTEITHIPNALDKIKQISGCTYNVGDKPSAGVIAQEILKVLPETVHTRDDGYYAVSYHGLIGLLIEAVKELSEKVK